MNYIIKILSTKQDVYFFILILCISEYFNINIMKTRQKHLTIATLTLLHNIFFWKESMGINLVLFTTIGILINLYSVREEVNWSKTKPFLFMHLLACTTLLYNGSTLAIASVCMNASLTIVFVQHQAFRSVAFVVLGFLERFIHWIASIGNLFVKSAAPQTSKTRPSYSILQSSKLVIVPILVFTIFFIIFNIANPIFHNYTVEAYEYIGDSLNDLTEYFSIERFLLFVLGFITARFLVFRALKLDVLKEETALQIGKQRIKLKLQKFKILALLTEYRVGVILVGMVNILLLLVNIIDINWLWFGFDPNSVDNLSQLVHEGTYVLIFSILLSMGIIEYFFRGNINFYKKNASLKALCYVWILQNIVLIASVAIRNYHYIDEMGLAHKRIGVVFFLCLTLSGLVSQVFKIAKKYSGYYLWKVNSLSLWLILTLGALVNWDLVIAAYNLKYTKKNLDTSFLLTLSDTTLGLLQQNKTLFTDNQYAPEVYQVTVKDYLYSRVVDFKERYEGESWLSWNYSDYKAYEQLKQ